jgi:hypothetical protein
VGVSFHIFSAVSPRWPCLACTGAFCPCICRQPPGKRQRLSNDDSLIATDNVTSKATD